MNQKLLNDHITQESYIKHCFGTKGFLIFYKDHGRYRWKLCPDYGNNLFMYKGKSSTD